MFYYKLIKTSNNITITISYITNVKPNIISSFKSLFLFKNKNNSKLLSRNFFLFLLLLKYNRNKSILINTSLFIKPFYKRFDVILRPPYRHKLSRHQILVNRFHVLCVFIFDSPVLKILTLSNLIYWLKTLKQFYKWFESNIVYQHQVKIFFNFIYHQNFIINNFIPPISKIIKVKSYTKLRYFKPKILMLPDLSKVN